jgi:hypothetical protein
VQDWPTGHVERLALDIYKLVAPPVNYCDILSRGHTGGSCARQGCEDDALRSHADVSEKCRANAYESMCFVGDHEVPFGTREAIPDIGLLCEIIT